MNRLISFLQAFGIVLVVSEHLGYYDSALYNQFVGWIQKFSMPLFMFISGYLMKFTEKAGGGIVLHSFALKKAKRLLIPYAVISSLAFLPKIAMNRWAIRPIDLSFESYLHGLIFPADNPIMFFWFLPTIFLIFIVVASTLKFVRSSVAPYLWMTVGATFIVSNIEISPLFNLTGVFHFILWFGLGYWFVPMQERIVRLFRLDSAVVCALLFVLTITQVFWPVTILRSVIGILFAISLGLLYLRREWHFFDHLFGYSFSIYLFSWFPQVAVRIFGLQVFDLPWFVVWPFSIALGIYVPRAIARFVEKRFAKGTFARILVGV